MLLCLFLATVGLLAVLILASSIFEQSTAMWVLQEAVEAVSQWELDVQCPPTAPRLSSVQGR